MTLDQRTLNLKVANTGFLLDRMGADCHPLQFLRELTQNSIEAIQRTGSGGEIRWDVDWNTFNLGDDAVYKLSVIDTGDGMTGEEMELFINQLSSSVSGQSMQGNYGVGAKIAAATRNPAGLIYMSWKDGHGHMIHLWRDPQTGQYGLRQIERPGGSFGHYAEIEDDVKPDLIDEHGTMVVLLGSDEGADTMRGVEGVASPSRWIAKYLNSRYYAIPEDIAIRAREGWENPRTDVDRNLLRTIMGQRKYLDAHSEDAGTVQLDGADIQWWILRDEKALSSNSGWIESAGHIAALYQDELYETLTGRAGRARLQNFGVLFGTNRVVIYVEPDESLALTTNTARTQLLIDNEPLPWAEWASEFASDLPAPLQALVEEVAAGSSQGDHQKAIRDRLKNILDLFKVSRYRPAADGEAHVDPTRLQRSKTGSASGGNGSRRDDRPRSTGGAPGGIYSVFLKEGGEPARAVNSELFPETTWVSVEDGTREHGDMEDRAARYLIDRNTLLINADFRAFRDMVERWMNDWPASPGVARVVEDAVRGWFEQALVETVLGVLALKESKEWATQDIETGLSEIALTSAVMQRYHINVAVKRELGSKLGKLKAAV